MNQAIARAPRSFIEPPGQRIAGLGFRPIDESDMGFLCDLYAQVRRDELAPVPWPDELKREFLRSQFNLQHQHYHQHNPHADFLLIERAGERVGRIYINRVPGEIRVMEVSLLESERGQGLGTRLFMEIFAEARAADARVTLHVEPNNRALQLYQRLGFKVLEQRGVYWFLACEPGDQLKITS